MFKQSKNINQLILTLFFSLILTAGFTSAGLCGDINHVKVKDAWARSALKGMNSAAYMTLHNAAKAGDSLVKVESSVAEVVEIHEVIDQNGMMMMRPIKGVMIPAGSSATLKPGGYHIMIINLKKDLKAGDQIDLALGFKNGGEVSLNAPVKEMQIQMQMKHPSPHGNSMPMQPPVQGGMKH